MRVLMVFFVLMVTLACDKEKCYNCTQNIRVYTNKFKKGYPKEFKTKIISCSDNNPPIIDNDEPIVINDTIGDTIFTYWKDTECVKKSLF
jgi:hypothetical protein